MCSTNCGKYPKGDPPYLNFLGTESSVFPQFVKHLSLDTPPTARLYLFFIINREAFAKLATALKLEVASFAKASRYRCNACMHNSPIILSVSELTLAIKSQLEPMFRHIWVRGEVTNFHLQTSGHQYFSLIEGGSQLSAVMFRASAASLLQPIKNGDTLIAEGEISVYPPRGSYQLVVRQVMHVGLGEALLKLKALQKKLSALGWFRPERKRPLPSDIRTIGLVTSPTGAVLHDIINILTRRLGRFHLIVNPVRVQGEGAAVQIARAIHEFNLYSLADVIIICRGGGSAEDLAAFNEEIVAAACVQSTIPIVSAIGHETDLSITDLVADLRAPTPSAAAELVSSARSERRERLSIFSNNAHRLIKNQLRNTFLTLHTFTKRCDQTSPRKKIEFYALRLDEMEASLTEAMFRCLSSKQQLLSQTSRALRQQAPTTKLAEQRTRLLHLEKAVAERVPMAIGAKKTALVQISRLIDEKMSRHLLVAQQRYASRDWKKELLATLSSRLISLQRQFSAIISNLQALNPKRTLERGYAIVFRGDLKDSDAFAKLATAICEVQSEGRASISTKSMVGAMSEESAVASFAKASIVRSIHTVMPQEPVTIMVADGTFSAIVQGKEP